MTGSMHSDFLVELGTEELPPKALRSLMLAFAENLERLLAEHRLEHDSIQPYASPRRLALLVPALATRQPDREFEAKGPPVSVAFDESGAPKPAAIAFARKCGVEVDALERVTTGKGEWLSFTSTEEGVAANDLLAGLVERALAGPAHSSAHALGRFGHRVRAAGPLVVDAEWRVDRSRKGSGARGRQRNARPSLHVIR